MTLHQHDPKRRDDAEFLAGEPAFLIPGNRCRLLDGRRTPGYIAEVDMEHAMFTFFIERFEDAGKTWDLYAKDVSSFQFELDAKRLTDNALQHLNERMQHYRTPLVIEVDETCEQRTIQRINSLKEEVRQRCVGLQPIERTDVLDDSMCEPYQQHLDNWMDASGFADIEADIARQMVLNPSAGERGKQVSIALAKLGLVSYEGTILRRPEHDEERLREYLLHRLAFVRTLCATDLRVYRGMSSEGPFRTIVRSLASWTDSLEVAQAFAEIHDPRFPSVYLVKHLAPIEHVLMTHVETRAFHDAYNEREVVLMQRAPITL